MSSAREVTPLLKSADVSGINCELSKLFELPHPIPFWAAITINYFSPANKVISAGGRERRQQSPRVHIFLFKFAPPSKARVSPNANKGENGAYCLCVK